MSDETRVYGCVEGAWRFSDKALYVKNKEAIDALPEEDEWPPLDRGIFAVPMPKSQAKPGFHRTQMIHFGISFKNFNPYWAEWLEKFEMLLKQMYWYEVHLHLDMETRGEFDYLWTVDREITGRFLLEPPLPVNEWSFTGGPRFFE